MLENCACHNLKQTTRQITRLYDQALRPAGINSGQFSIIGKIKASPKCDITTLALELNMDRTTLTRNLQPLFKKSLIIQHQGADKRVHFLSLSKKGQNIFATALPIWQEIQEKVGNIVGKNNLSNLLQGLETLRTKLPAIH